MWMILSLDDSCAGNVLAVSRHVCGLWIIILCVVIQLGNPQRQNVIYVIPQVGKDFLANIVLKNFFMGIISLGNIEVMGNFSEVTIFVLSKFAPVGHLILDLDRKNFDKNFCPSLGCLLLP